MPSSGRPDLFGARTSGALRIRNRRFLRARLHAWRVLRRHYLTFVSGAVFVGLLLTVFTSASFGIEDPPRDTAGPEEVEPSSNTVNSPTVASPASAAVPAYRPRPRSYPVIYYLVDSKEQQYAMEQAIETDSALRVRQGPNDPANAHRQVLLITNPEQERQSDIFILDIAYAAAAEGVAVMVVDLR